MRIRVSVVSAVLMLLVAASMFAWSQEQSETKKSQTHE
jgi:hypothetical protein